MKYQEKDVEVYMYMNIEMDFKQSNKHTESKLQEAGKLRCNCFFFRF